MANKQSVPTEQDLMVPQTREAFLANVSKHYGAHGFNAAKDMSAAELAELAQAFGAIASA